MRPEEIIADIYRQLCEKQTQGERPKEVLMTLEQYRLLSWYRRFLGDIGKSDYLDDYNIFGLDILVDRGIEGPRVC